MTETTGKQTPLFGGRMRITPDGRPELIGMRCNECSINLFPKSMLCPRCGKDTVQEITLSSKGRVWTYTEVHVSYGSVALEVPYIASFVELDDGAYVHTLIVGCDPEDMEIGMEVELVALEAKGDEDSKNVVYAFKPAPPR